MSKKTYMMEDVNITNSEGMLLGVGVNENDQHHSGAQLNARLYQSLAEGDFKALQQEIACLREMVSPVDESSVLHLAVPFGHGPLISFLLDQAGTELIKKENKKGDLAFHMAARVGNVQALKSMVTWVENKEQNWSASSSCSSYNGVEVGGIKRSLIGKENKDKNTALHIAVQNGFEDVAKVLVDAWPSASFHLNAQGICPLYLAIESKYWELVGHMLDKQPFSEDVARDLLKGKSVVHASILAENKDILARLLNVVSIDAHDEEGRSPLSYAAYLGFLEGVNYILEKYPKHAYKQDGKGSFPIHWAAGGGKIEVINEFLNRFPNTKVSVNNKAQNIFHMACGNGKDKMVKFLLKYQGLDTLINSKDEDGNSPLHLATKHMYPKVVYLLTWDKRVQLGLLDKDGFTARDIAEELPMCPTLKQRLTSMALRSAGATRTPGHTGPMSRASTNKDSDIDKREDQINHGLNTILLVATLVTTVAYDASIHSPGGYDEFGKARLANTLTYQTFTIINTIAMYSSVIVTVVLVWAYLSDLKIKLVSLEFSVRVLAVALYLVLGTFSTAIVAAFDQSYGFYWVVIAIVSVFSFAFLVFLCLLGLEFWASHAIGVPSDPHYLLILAIECYRHILHYPFQLLLWMSSWDKTMGAVII